MIRVSRVQVPEFASPLLALRCDGALYDVAILEGLWGLAPSGARLDFHTRVISTRGAGLRRLASRLEAGERPAAARIDPETCRILPPCDPERASYFQLGPYAWTGRCPLFQRRDCRGLVGDQHSVSVTSRSAELEVGLAAVLGEELWRAGPQQAEQAILGFSLMLDWGDAGDRWRDGALAESASQLGPALVLGPSLVEIAQLSGRLVCDRVVSTTPPMGSWHFHPAEALAYLSQHARLRPGDVVGLGAVLRLQVESRQRCRFVVAPLLRLEGWMVPGRPPVPWRLPRRS